MLLVLLRPLALEGGGGDNLFAVASRPTGDKGSRTAVITEPSICPPSMYAAAFEAAAEEANPIQAVPL